MREYPQAIRGRSVGVSRPRWPDWISRIKRSHRARAERRIDVIARRAQQVRAGERAWDFIPDPRWHRGRRR